MHLNNEQVWTDSTASTADWTDSGVNDDFPWCPVDHTGPMPKPAALPEVPSWPVDRSGRRWRDRDTVAAIDGEVTWPEGWCRAPPGVGSGSPTSVKKESLPMAGRTEMTDMKRGEPLYTTEINPHNALEPNREGPETTWRCFYCGQSGPWDEINAIACTHVYPPCPHCGCTPICAADCSGIWKLLMSPDVYLAGTHGDGDEAGR